MVETNTQYSDGTWVYPWLWAVYLKKTGDTAFLASRWTSDNYQALLGLAGYEYLARVAGNKAEASNTTLSATITANHLNYIPCSMVEPNTANRCANPEDANRAAPGVYFNWAWNADQLGAPVTAPGGGTMAGWIDQTLSYGFGPACCRPAPSAATRARASTRPLTTPPTAPGVLPATTTARRAFSVTSS